MIVRPGSRWEVRHSELAMPDVVAVDSGQPLEAETALIEVSDVEGEWRWRRRHGEKTAAFGPVWSTQRGDPFVRGLVRHGTCIGMPDAQPLALPNPFQFIDSTHFTE